jgi:hypothetical protein
MTAPLTQRLTAATVTTVFPVITQQHASNPRLRQTLSIGFPYFVPFCRTCLTTETMTQCLTAATVTIQPLASRRAAAAGTWMD